MLICGCLIRTTVYTGTQTHSVLLHFLVEWLQSIHFYLKYVLTQHCFKCCLHQPNVMWDVLFKSPNLAGDFTLSAEGDFLFYLPSDMLFSLLYIVKQRTAVLSCKLIMVVLLRFPFLCVFDTTEGIFQPVCTRSIAFWGLCKGFRVKPSSSCH